MRTTSYLLVLAIALPACSDNGGGSGGSGGPCGTATPVMATAQDVHDRIFQCSCVFSSCHDSGSHKASMNLETLSSACAAMQMNSCEFPTKKRADTANPDNSIILKKLGCSGPDCTSELGVPDSHCQELDSNNHILNERMPAGDNPPLDSGRIATLRTWISMGLPGCTPAVDAGVDAPAGSDAGDE